VHDSSQIVIVYDNRTIKIQALNTTQKASKTPVDSQVFYFTFATVFKLDFNSVNCGFTWNGKSAANNISVNGNMSIGGGLRA
jgi:hypothetical protein